MILGLATGYSQDKKSSKKDYLITISTPFGEMKAILFDSTPKHKANFVKLAQEGFYDSTTFHRIIDNFMIQGGDPNSKDDDPFNDGRGGPDYTIDAEISPNIKHQYGSIAAARKPNPEKKSSGSQFYIVENKGGTPHLDGAYTVFGIVVQGLDVIDKIAEQKKDRMDRPVENIYMTVKVEYLKKKKITKLTGYKYP